jgi:hypothetical protein
VFAADMPVGLVVADGPLFEAAANGDAGPAEGARVRGRPN